MISSLSSILTELRTLLTHPSLSFDEKKARAAILSSSIWIEESELARSLLACLSHKLSLPFTRPHFQLTESGALFMLKRALFPWGTLPYPCDHAEAGWALAEIGEEAIAKKMALFQRAISDHKGEPILSLLSQEKEKNSKWHREIQKAFLEKVSCSETLLPPLFYA